MRTKLYKAALLTTLGLSSIATAQAGTDMLLGFNDAAGPSGAQNDYVIDLGATSLFTTTAQLNYSLNSSLFSTDFSADTSYLNDVAVGVVGGNTSNPNSTQYLFMSGQALPNSASITELLGAANAAQGTSVGSSASGASGTWSYQVAPSPISLGLVAANGTSVGAYIGSNPLNTLSGGSATFNLYEDTATQQSHGTVSGWSEVGTFAVNVNSGAVSFTGVDVVPEPSTCSLLGGAGLLVLIFRRKTINRKNA